MTESTGASTITVRLQKKQLDVLIQSLQVSRALLQTCESTLNALTEALEGGRQEVDVRRGEVEVVLEDLHELIVEVLEQAQSPEAS